MNKKIISCNSPLNLNLFNKLKITQLVFLASCLLSLASASLAQPERFIPGKDYTLLENPLTDRTPDVVEVVEYFWYGCPGCYQFESSLSQWIEKQDDNVLCLRLPAIWDDWREVHARAYYTASTLGMLEQMHDVIFTAMHVQGNRLRNESELEDLFAEQGINRSDFTRAYNSFAVNTEIKRARSTAVQAGAINTPSIIVNGKYLVSYSRNTLDIVDFLVQKELL